jgi:hypothetical protein
MNENDPKEMYFKLEYYSERACLKAAPLKLSTCL